MNDALQDFISKTSIEPFDIGRNSCAVWVLRWKLAEKGLHMKIPLIASWDEARRIDVAGIFRDYVMRLGLEKVDSVERGDIGLFQADSRFDIRTGVSMGIAINSEFWGFRGIRGIRFMKKEPVEAWR